MTASAPAAIAREVTSEIRTHLDRVDALEPRRGQLDLGAYVRGTGGSSGAAGARLDYQHRLNRSTSVFGEGAVGYGWGTTTGLDYQATTGLRMRF